MTLPIDASTSSQQKSHSQPDPASLVAICGVTFLCSIGTGIVWAGVPFIAKHQYDMSKQATFCLYLALGLTYVGGALSTGWGIRRVERVVSARAVLAIILSLSAAFSASLLVSGGTIMLWVAAIAINVLSSWLWPIVESFLTAGRHGESMRRSIGVWNLTWTGAVFASLLLMAPLVARHAAFALIGTSFLYLLALLFVPLLPAMPSDHTNETNEHGSGARSEYPALLASARWLLVSSYVLNSAMSPLLPFLIARLAVSAEWAAVVASMWTGARLVTVTFMWRSGFWHGRWGTLLAGGCMLGIGFVLVVVAAELLILLTGLALVGAGMGVTYFAALYYAMSVGRGAVDAGGKHEALIGMGYTVGPVAGLLSELAARQFNNPVASAEGVMVLVIAVMLTPAAFGAMNHYRTAVRELRSKKRPRRQAPGS